MTKNAKGVFIPIPKMLVDKDDDRNAVCQGGRRKHTVCMVRKSNDDRQHFCHKICLLLF